MKNQAIDVNRIAAFQQDQARQSKNDLDTARVDWCEANLNHLVWVGTRIVIRDHAGTSSDAATLRRAIDVARQRAATSLGDVVRIDHRQSVDAFNSPAIDLTALRYETLINLVTGKHAQQFLTEMCWDGSAPTRKQLEAKLDKMIEEAR